MTMQINRLHAATETQVPRVQVRATNTGNSSLANLLAFNLDATSPALTIRSGHAPAVLIFAEQPSPADVLAQAAGRGQIGVAGGCTFQGTGAAVNVTRSHQGYDIQIFTGGFALHEESVHVSDRELHNGRLSPAQRQAIETVREQLTLAEGSSPTPTPEALPINPLEPLAPGTSFPPLVRTTTGSAPTLTVSQALKDLQAAIARGPMGHGGGCTDPGQAVEVTQTDDGFNVRISSGGIMLHVQDVNVRLADLQNGHLTREQRQALETVHEQLQQAQ